MNILCRISDWRHARASGHERFIRRVGEMKYWDTGKTSFPLLDDVMRRGYIMTGSLGAVTWSGAGDTGMERHERDLNEDVRTA